MGWFNKNEPIPVPEAGWNDEPTCSVSINSDWVEVVIGLLEIALLPDFWDGTESEIESAQRSVLEIQAVLGDCMTTKAYTAWREFSGSESLGAAGLVQRVLTSDEGNLPDAALEDGFFWLPAGTYIIFAETLAFRATNAITVLRRYWSESSYDDYRGMPLYDTTDVAGGQAVSSFSGYFSLTELTKFGVYTHHLNAYTYSGGYEAYSYADCRSAQVVCIKIA